MGSSRIISFDLSHAKTPPLDISRFFPFSELHAIRSTKPLFDTIKNGKGNIPNLSLSRRLRISRFRTIAMLDLGRADLYESDLIGRTLLEEKPRPRTLDLFPPLDIPYGALDTRGEPRESTEKYGDIYRRSLPWSLHARRTTRDVGRYISKKRKPIFIGLACFSLLSLPALLYTKLLIENGYASLRSLAHAENQTKIVEDIRAARSDFERANVIFTPLRWIPGDTINLAGIALDGGLSLSRGLSHIADTLVVTSGSLQTVTNGGTSLFRPESKSLSPLARLGIEEPTEWIRENKNALTTLDEAIKKAGTLYEKAENIDHPMAKTVTKAGNALSRVGGILDFTLAHETDILALLGADTPERYIVFNQNRDEIRANGGFPGSIITFTLYKGNIEDFRTDDVYYYDWNLYPYKEPPPPGLSLISGNYGLRDVNYYASFRDTLDKANNFIEKSGDPTVTIGVAIHQGLVEDMLGVLSGVTLSGVNIPFTSENFSPLMSTLVESRYGERTSAKDVLGDFVSAFFEKVENQKAYSDMFDIVEKALADGEILFASRSDAIDTFLANYRKPLPTSPNWIYPLLTSTSGNKSDRHMMRLYRAETTRASECTYENKITFTHTHDFSKDDEKEINSYMDFVGLSDPLAREKMLFIQGKGKNSTYVRLVVPPSATLIGSAAGTETLTENGQKEFAFTLVTPLSATSSKTIRYSVDVPGCDGSTPLLEWYRQPGLQNTKMQSR